MLNRRQLRIKVLHALYGYFQEKDRDMPKAERQLFFAVDKFFELYIYLMAIMQRVHQLRIEKREMQTKRIMATAEDLNPSRRFTDNPILVELQNNKAINEATERLAIQWDEDRMDIIRDVHAKMMVHEEYLTYMDAESVKIEDHVKVVSSIFKHCIANNDLVQHFLDEMSIYWADDLDLAASMGLKTLKSFKSVKEVGTGKILGLYKDEDEEREFVQELFRQTIIQSIENENLLDTATSNWKLERIAYMDMIIMKMALAEVRTFRSIPTKVTMNEYLELSKYYSTPNSSGFINGVLDKLFAEMTESGLINKMGRGLLES